VDTRQREAADSAILPAIHEAWLPNEHSLYRPRHGNRQLTALISAIVFFCTPMLLLVLGVRPEAIENKTLAGFPSPADGWGFFTGLDEWAGDTLPLRGESLRVEDWISRNVFGEPPQLGDKQPDAGPVQGPAQGPLAPTPDNGDDPEKPAHGFPKVIEGRDGWYYLGYDIQGPCRPDRPLDDVIAGLRRLRAAVENSGRKFVFVVAPDKSTMMPEHLPASYPGAACARSATATLWQRVLREAGAVDLRPVLQAVADRTREPIYTKVDTHWSYVGGLVMATAVAERVQPGVTASWQIFPGQTMTRPGDLPPLIGRQEQYQLKYFDLAPDGRTVRSEPIEDDFHTARTLTQPTGRGIVSPRVGVVADSFTELALPYFAGGFADITVVHTDTAETDPAQVARMLAGKDVVVFEAIQRSLAGGTNAVLSDRVLDAIEAELARHPRR